MQYRNDWAANISCRRMKKWIEEDTARTWARPLGLTKTECRDRRWSRAEELGTMIDTELGVTTALMRVAMGLREEVMLASRRLLCTVAAMMS